MVLEATHEAVLRDVEPELLREYEYGRGERGDPGGNGADHDTSADGFESE